MSVNRYPITNPLIRSALPLLLLATATFARAADLAVAVVWEKPTASVTVSVERGTLLSATPMPTSTDAANTGGPFANVTRLELVARPAPSETLPCLITIHTAPRDFTFRAADPDAKYPIYLPDDHVVVTVPSDRRSYSEIVAAVAAQAQPTKLQRIAAAREPTF